MHSFSRAKPTPQTKKARQNAARLAQGAVRRLRRGAHRVRRGLRTRVNRLDPFLDRRDVRRSAPERFVRAAYQIMLQRQGDPGGIENYVQHLRTGTLTPAGVLDEMLTSMELRQEVPFRNRLRSLHQSRCDWIRMLPRAQRILDLGGTDQENAAGSLVSMGYPYAFESLTIVDLPHADRHDLYSGSEVVDRVQSPLGPVEYRYHSMADLSAYDDASFDLVFSGESIEHITEAEARTMLAEVRRVMTPDGWFCLDTPNRRATALELGDHFCNPDHKIEYTDPQLAHMLIDAGFTIEARYGLSYVGDSLAKGEFDPEEVARNHGVFADIDGCYLLAYTCRLGEVGRAD